MITGGIVRKVSAEKLKEGPGQGMDVNIKTDDVEFDKSKFTLKYTFDITFKPDLAKMSLEGEVYFEETEKRIKELREKWEKDKQLPEDVMADIITAVNYTCSAVGTLLAFAVNVNAPINVPRVRLTKQEAQKAG
ncbi:hypothetical protein HY571_00630 [Candidatus Micrarchaeota archaeon]|nr:hypothetical protein [Candidatus Micrarchaeota archaeon]